jgi:hypothetical protein
MTASIDHLRDDLLARLEPKSIATFGAVVGREHGDAVERQPSSASALEEGTPHHHVFVNFTTDAAEGLAAVFPLIAGAEWCEPASRALTHFNVNINHLMVNLLRHCDFRSVPLPEFSSIWDNISATQSDWRAVLGIVCAAPDDDDHDALLDLVYEESTYTPRPRNLKVLSNVPVRVDPNATRAARVYTPEDAEGWVR